MTPLQRGIRAFKKYADYKKGNPYNPGTSNYKQWELGFNQAYFENLEKVNGKKARD